jgi:hypothetical protein
MKKRLNVDAIANELKGGSAFFPEYNKSTSPDKENKPSGNIQDAHTQITTKEEDMIPRHHDTVIPRHHETMTPSEMPDHFEAIRRAVKQFGKEAATFRFTAQEKAELRDIEYTYGRQGIKTSGNEITRVSINFIIDDYKTNGEQSILAKILTLLHR